MEGRGSDGPVIMIIVVGNPHEDRTLPHLVLGLEVMMVRLSSQTTQTPARAGDRKKGLFGLG